MRVYRPNLLTLLLPTLVGCSESPASSEALVCGAGLVAFRGACVDAALRYEPEEQLDTDNVVAFGDPIETLLLPPPPKSGFRIVVPPRTLMPGEEQEFCVSWPIPEVKRPIVHGARLHTTPGLHHSNVVAKPVNKEIGENPYPSCHPGADDPFVNVGAGIPDVLFANSTQVVGEESLVFPEGMGWKLDTTREISTNIHLLNPKTEPLRVEIAYDFFTMPDEDLIEEVAPFVVQISQFSIPPHTTEAVSATCQVFGGRVVSLMSHTHDLLERYTVDLRSYDGKTRRVYDEGAFNEASDIRTYDPGLDLEGVESIRHECLFNNTRDVEVQYGVGLNEMCLLFGYVYPPVKQFAAFVEQEGGPCTSLQIGLFR